MNRIIFVLGILILSIGIVTGSLFFLLSNEQDMPIDVSLPNIIKTISPAVVSISGTSINEASVTSRDGTGIIVRSDGLILTSKHLLGQGLSYMITLDDGMKYPATLVKNHPSLDLSILALVSDVPLALPVGKFINSQASIQQGDSVIGIGNMLGLYPGSVSSGIISGLNRTVSFSGVSTNGLIQTTLPMHLGSSGGPLIASDGKIIGINTGIVGGNSQIGWALPVTQEEIDSFLQE